VGAKYHTSAEKATRKLIFWQISGPNVYPYSQDFLEKIVERSIQGTKPSGMKKQKPQSIVDPGVEIITEDDSPEPEEVMMVEVT
jgi:hypothetical protein